MASQVLINTCSEFIIQLVKEAGEVVVEGFNGIKNVETKGGRSYDLVTEYDKRVEEILITRLGKQFPDHLFIGEESSAESKTKPVLTDAPTWIIDPIDGTTNFVHGLPIIGISVALAIKKEVVVGVVHNPVINQLYSAVKGKGAFLNGIPIHSSKTEELDKSIICTETSLARISYIRERTLERTHKVTDLVQGIRSLGSAAMTLCYVASGGLDGYFTDGLQCWDVAAGALIVTEAGGFVCNADGSEFNMFSRMLFAAGNKIVGEKLLKVIKECDEKTKAITEASLKKANI